MANLKKKLSPSSLLDVGRSALSKVTKHDAVVWLVLGLFLAAALYLFLWMTKDQSEKIALLPLAAGECRIRTAVRFLVWILILLSQSAIMWDAASKVLAASKKHQWMAMVHASAPLVPGLLLGLSVVVARVLPDNRYRSAVLDASRLGAVVFAGYNALRAAHAEEGVLPVGGHVLLGAAFLDGSFLNYFAGGGLRKSAPALSLAKKVNMPLAAGPAKEDDEDDGLPEKDGVLQMSPDAIMNGKSDSGALSDASSLPPARM